MSRGFRIVTGALARNGGRAGGRAESSRTGKRRAGRRAESSPAWRGFLTVAPFDASGQESEGEGEGATPADALKAAVDDLAKQGAFDGEEGA